MLDRPVSLAVQLKNLGVQELDVFPFPLQPCEQSRRQRRPIPQPDPVEEDLQIPTFGEPYSLTRQEPLYPIRRASMLLLQRPQLAMQLPPVFLLNGGNPH